MTTLNAIKKIEKATGKKVTIDGKRVQLDYNDKYVLGFNNQYGEASVIYINNKKDPNNIITDYFSSFYFSNISQALKFLIQ